jgi:eukaryotic-like serine/threonine-protein kinase
MGTKARLRIPRCPFLDAVRRSGLLTPDDLVAFITRHEVTEATFADPILLATLFVRHRLLTKYQAMQLLNGKTQGFLLDQYKILEGVRQDRVGLVFLAEDTRLHRVVYLKVLPSDRVADNTIFEVFVQEVRAAAAVEHPNQSRVLNMGCANGTHYVATEYVPGTTLDKVIAEKGAISPNLAAQCVARVAVALRYAHEQGLCHRDVKPGNVALTTDGRVKLLDLGLAQMLENPWARVTRRINLKEYAEEIDHVAPEQAWGNEPDARGDVYSLGSTFYTLLTGQSPFPGTAAEKMAKRQIQDIPAPSLVRKGVPRELDAIVQKMGAKNPHERYQTADDVVLALQPWLPVAEWAAIGAALKPTAPKRPAPAVAATPSFFARALGWFGGGK